jgi:hypothetical protein
MLTVSCASRAAWSIFVARARRPRHGRPGRARSRARPSWVMARDDVAGDDAHRGVVAHSAVSARSTAAAPATGDSGMCTAALSGPGSTEPCRAAIAAAMPPALLHAVGEYIVGLVARWSRLAETPARGDARSQSPSAPDEGGAQRLVVGLPPRSARPAHRSNVTVGVQPQQQRDPPPMDIAQQPMSRAYPMFAGGGPSASFRSWWRAGAAMGQRLLRCSQEWDIIPESLTGLSISG